MAEPANPTTTGEVSDAIRAVIVEETIFANAEYLVWDNFAMHRQAAQDGSGALFPILAAIANATTALDADANPAPSQLAGSSKTITTAEYGLPVELQKKLLRTSQENVARDAISVIATNMATTRDALAGIKAVAGSTVRFAEGKADAGHLASTSIMSRAEIVRAWAALKAQRAPMFPGGTYMAGVHPYSLGDLFGSGANAGDFIDVAKYADPTIALTGEIGRWQGFRFFEASQQTYDDAAAGGDGGAFTADKTLSVFAGTGYLGFAWSQMPEIIPIFDSNDRLKRFVNVGWYGDFAYDRIREANGYRIEARSAYAPLP